MDVSIIGSVPDVLASIEAFTVIVNALAGLTAAATALIVKISLLIAAVGAVVVAGRKLVALFKKKNRQSVPAARKRSTSGSSRTRD